VKRSIRGGPVDRGKKGKQILGVSQKKKRPVPRLEGGGVVGGLENLGG